MYIVPMNGAPQRCSIKKLQPVTKKKNNYAVRPASLLKWCALLFLFIFSVSASAQYSRKDLRKLRKGKLGVDTSFVYQLPFAPGTKHLVVQGYYGWFSHKGRLALDFKMPVGTEVHAVRGGVVTRVRESGTKGGWNEKYRSEGNNIIITHEDGSRAGYWHLQFEGALVNVGDTVKQGQLIGLSGKTGYTTAAHLHLIIWTNRGGGWQQVPTRFLTQKGVRYLRVFRKYKAIAVEKLNKAD